MTIRNTRKAAAPVAGIVGFTPEQAATLRTGVNAALAAGKAIATGKAAQGNATDILIAGMANAALLAHRFEFQARDRKGNVTETKLASLYDYARKAAPFYVAGKEQRARITGFKAAVLAYAAGVNDASTPAAESAWTLIKGKALPVAIALADNVIAATLSGSKLALSGGNGSTVASGLIDAAKKSTSALVGKVTAKGTNAPKLATPVKAAAPIALDTEAAMRMALAYLIKVAAGDEAISNKRIGLLKGIAKAAADIIAQEAAAAAAKA
jgi:predicted aconitase with swiveling domain